MSQLSERREQSPHDRQWATGSNNYREVVKGGRRRGRVDYFAGGMVELDLVGPGALLPHLTGFQVTSHGSFDKIDSLPRWFASPTASSCVVMRVLFQPIPATGCLPLPVVWHAPKVAQETRPPENSLLKSVRHGGIHVIFSFMYNVLH